MQLFIPKLSITKSHLEEDLSTSKLVVCILENGRTYLAGCCSAILLVTGPNSTHQQPVPVHKFGKLMPDGISSTADSYGLHHARVPQLLAAEASFKHLGTPKITKEHRFSKMHNFSIITQKKQN